MSNNEETTEASSRDAASGPVAPAPTPGNNPTSTTPPPAGPSRFYSRLSRGVGTPAKPAAAEAGPVSIEGLTPEEAVQLKDNLPVRANFDGPIDDSRDEGPRDRERRPRSDSHEDRPGRGRDRGRDRDRSRGRERNRDFRERDPQESAPIEDNAEETSATINPETDNGTNEPARQLRFEDVGEHHTPQTVQEFRPSTDRGFAADAGRARKRREERSVPTAPIQPAKPKGGLMGWMKSIFSPSTEETTAPPTPAKEPRGPRRERGPRRDRRGGGGGGKPQSGGSSSRGEGQGGDGNRRRRRRGGRNRRRSDGGGGGGRSGPRSGGGQD